MPKEEVVKAYFERDRIEKSFRTLKSVLEAKPLRFQLDKRIRACVMLCHLAYLVAAYIEMKLRENGLDYSVEKVRELLDSVHIIRRGNRPLKWVSSMTEEQKKVMKVFGCCHNLG